MCVLVAIVYYWYCCREEDQLLEDDDWSLSAAIAHTQVTREQEDAAVLPAVTMATKPPTDCVSSSYFSDDDSTD